ncbi:ABC transporter permease [Paenibacillus sp. MER TA 81-3]|uniref:ABC transporter permease n=1 Tax=Paenibacillus sp. MER TA 81-3 TaxID=2939573 RepID=UPI00203A55E4|nr:ABC transporter permease [Paenibacillus sp. MER TA 81-3]MCM3339230.1 ABC transporter permease [Paenibacillus sp. MER TA 81-3]
MRKLYIFSKFQTSLLLRSFKSTIVGFLLPVVMFFIFSNMLAELEVPETGKTIVDYLVPAFIPIIIINAVIVIYGQYYMLYKEQGNLLKYKLLGLNTFSISFGIFLATLIFQIIATLFLIIFAVVTKGVTVPYGNLLSVIFMMLLINLYQFAIVIFMASLINKSTTYQSVSLIIFYIQIFLGGLTFPPEMFPVFIKEIVYIVNPIIYGLVAMRGIWADGQSILNYSQEVMILSFVSIGLIAIGMFISKKREKLQYQ